MHIVSLATPMVLKPDGRHACRALGALMAFAGLLGAFPSEAQLSARLTEKKNVVKFSRNDRDFLDAPLQQPLDRGYFLVTGLRSMAGVLFSDNSYLRVNESSKVIVTAGSRQRDVSIQGKNSAVYGKYNGPGRVVGQQALCAVRGTEFELQVLNDRDVIRCFGPQTHQVLVTNKANALITGRVTTAGAGQFASADLIGNTENWIGGKLEFLVGAGGRQTRTVSAFDPVTGTLTLNAPLPNANNLNDWFYIINPPNVKVVVLEQNMETYLSHVQGAEPVDAYPTEPKEFAGGDALAFMNEPLHGDNQSHLTGFFLDRSRQANYQIDNARNAGQGYGNYAPGIQITSFQRNTGGGEIPGHQTGNLGVDVGSTGGSGNGNLNVSIGGGSPSGVGGLVINTREGRAIFPRVPEFGGVGFSTRGSDTALAYANDSVVVGGVYMRVGGRIGTLDQHSDNQLDELLLRYRNRHFGDIQVGRFHWLPGPVSNGQLGRLISFTSSDGVLWDLPTSGSVAVQVAWFDKLQALSTPNVSGYSARVGIPIKTGQLAFTALTTSQRTLGGTADFVYPILPQKLEIYGEGGIDTAHQTVYAAGLYFPQLFHKYRADFSVELSYRGHFGHSVDMALHVPFGKHITALATLSKPGPGSWRPGIGLQARF